MRIILLLLKLFFRVNKKNLKQWILKDLTYTFDVFHGNFMNRWLQYTNSCFPNLGALPLRRNVFNFPSVSCCVNYEVRKKYINFKK